METPAGTLRPWFNTADAILITFLLIVSLAGWGTLSKPHGNGTGWQCRVKVLGAPPSERSFSAIPTTPFQIQGRLGTSTIEWNAAGQVRFAASPCPHHVCIHSGWTGAPFNVICVPNGILVEFPGNHPQRLDGITR